MKIWSIKNCTALDFIIFSVVIVFFVIRIFLSSGELSPDSIQYLLQSQNFWTYKVNFPLGYGFLIKAFHYFTKSYFLASKIINLFSYVAIIIFSYCKKFFFPQTVLIFSFYPFINLYPQSFSEAPYFCINYLIIYFIHKIIQNGFTWKNNLWISLLFFLLIALRFSGLFVCIVSITFLGIWTYHKNQSLKTFLLFTLSSASGVCFYLFINTLYCGFPLGDRRHLQNEPPNSSYFISEFWTSVLHDFSFLNIFIHKGLLDKISSLHYFVSLIIIFFTLFVFVKKRKKLNAFNYYLIFSFLGIMISLLYSYYTTKIDHTIRIKSNAYMYLLFFISLNIPKMTIIFFKQFVILALFINSFTLVKYSEKLTIQIKKQKVHICDSKEKVINIVYKYDTLRNNAQVLLFKAILIDRKFNFHESDNHNKRVSGCSVKASDIVK
ncbi:MAG TPA: hypothetical protein DIW37_01645 [Chryseobacterium sp.]|nr:hypothetical protein [Chryseobacterium sp.]